MYVVLSFSVILPDPMDSTAAISFFSKKSKIFNKT